MEHGSVEHHGCFYSNENVYVKGICIKLYGFLKYFKNSIPHQNVHNNNVNTCCHVYMQNILIAGIGTFNYHVTIIFFKHMFIIDIFCS